MNLDRIINWDLLRQPYNWVLVILMLAIGFMILMMIQKPLSELPTGTLTAV